MMPKRLGLSLSFAFAFLSLGALLSCNSKVNNTALASKELAPATENASSSESEEPSSLNLLSEIKPLEKVLISSFDDFKTLAQDNLSEAILELTLKKTAQKARNFYQKLGELSNDPFYPSWSFGKIENLDFKNQKISFTLDLSHYRNNIEYILILRAIRAPLEITKIQGQKQLGFEISVEQWNSRINKTLRKNKIKKEKVSLKEFFKDLFINLEFKIENYNPDIVKKIKLFNTNDIHGRFFYDPGKFNKFIGLQRIAQYVFENEHDLFVDAGDLIQGLSIANSDQGQTMVKAANIIGFDFVTIGNHEFDFGNDKLLKYAQEAPFYSNNIVTLENPEGPSIYPSVYVKTIKGDLKVGLIGVTTPDINITTHPNNVIGLKADDIIKRTQASVDALEKAGVNFIIAIVHLGNSSATQTSLDLAEQVKGLDIIVDGHSHTLFEDNYKVADSYLLQTGEYSKHLGWAEFDFNRLSGKIENFNSSVHNFDVFANVSELEPLKAGFKELTDRFGKHNDVIVFNLEKDLSNDQVRNFETQMGNFAADSLEWYVRQEQKKAKAVAVVNSGGIRAAQEAGKISREDILNVFPFSNLVESYELTGQQLKEVFTRSAQNWSSGGFLQVSKNIKVELEVVDSKSKDKSAAKVLSLSVNGKEVVDTEKYILVVNDWLRVGGDGYDIFKTIATSLSGPNMESIIELYGQDLSKNKNENEYKWSLYFAASEASKRITISGANDAAKKEITKLLTSKDNS